VGGEAELGESDGVLEGVGSVGGEAEVAERREQGGGGERKDKI